MGVLSLAAVVIGGALFTTWHHPQDMRNTEVVGVGVGVLSFWLPMWELPHTAADRARSLRLLQSFLAFEAMLLILIFVDGARVHEYLNVAGATLLIFTASSLGAVRPAPAVGNAVIPARSAVSFAPDVGHRPWNAELAAKRTLDIAVASTCLILLMPVWPLIALAIKLDSRGPVLYRQKRRGLEGRIFRIYKFRSMTVLEEAGEIRQASRNDLRVTRVGAFLRRTSLDELPQLLNVLTGEMSLVGPRPHALVHDDYYGRLIAGYDRRHLVKPGITGWAQVNGARGETATTEAMRRRIDYDLWYLEHWSIWLDLRVLVATVPAVIQQENAY